MGFSTVVFSAAILTTDSAALTSFTRSSIRLSSVIVFMSLLLAV